MKAYRIEKDLSVKEVDIDVEDDLDDDIAWEALPLDDSHDIYYDGEGMFAPGVVTAKIGRHDRVPLPVYIVGGEGERQAAVTYPKAYIETIVT